jgi:predicted nucleic acid-binding protein
VISWLAEVDENRVFVSVMIDAFVAATAEARALVTRNVKDFERIGISLLDP